MDLIKYKVEKLLKNPSSQELVSFITPFIPDIVLDQIKQELIADYQQEIVKLDTNKSSTQAKIDSLL